MKENKSNCKCKCSNDDSEKDLLVGKLKEKIKEMIDSALEEISSTGGVAGFQTPYAFGNRGKDIAKKSMPDATVDETKKKAVVKVAPVAKPVNPDKFDTADTAVISKRQKAATLRGDKEGVKLYSKLQKLAKKQGVKQ